MRKKVKEREKNLLKWISAAGTYGQFDTFLFTRIKRIPRLDMIIRTFANGTFKLYEDYLKARQDHSSTGNKTFAQMMEHKFSYELFNEDEMMPVMEMNTISETDSGDDVHDPLGDFDDIYCHSENDEENSVINWKQYVEHLWDEHTFFACAVLPGECFTLTRDLYPTNKR